MILIPPACTCQPDERSFGMLLIRDPECVAHGDEAKRKRREAATTHSTSPEEG